MKTAIAILAAIALPALAVEPKVEMKMVGAAPCLDVTAEPMPAMCTYFTLNEVRFSISYRRDNNEMISIIYYPVDGEAEVIDRERMKEIINAKQLEGAI